MDSPRLFSVAASDGTRIFGAQGLEFEGRLWIVAEWLETPDEGWRTPERMICFDDIAHQSFPPGNELGIDFAINEAIPQAILDGSDPEPQASGYVVVRRPPLRIALEPQAAAREDGETNSEASGR